jgi:hypothetical protein
MGTFSSSQFVKLKLNRFKDRNKAIKAKEILKDKKYRRFIFKKYQKTSK